MPCTSANSVWPAPMTTRSWLRHGVTVGCWCPDHDFVQMLFASGETRPSVILTREVDTLTSAQIAELLIAALSPELDDLLAAGAIAALTPRRVSVRPLPLRPTAAS